MGFNIISVSEKQNPKGKSRVLGLIGKPRKGSLLAIHFPSTFTQTFSRNVST